MKIVGFALLLVGLCWAYMWRHDPAEGLYMRPIAFIAALAGIFVFFEGLKKEIIRAVKKPDDE